MQLHPAKLAWNPHKFMIKIKVLEEQFLLPRLGFSCSSHGMWNKFNLSIQFPLGDSSNLCLCFIPTSREIILKHGCWFFDAGQIRIVPSCKLM